MFAVVQNVQHFLEQGSLCEKKGNPDGVKCVASLVERMGLVNELVFHVSKQFRNVPFLTSFEMSLFGWQSCGARRAERCKVKAEGQANRACALGAASS